MSEYLTVQEAAAAARCEHKRIRRAIASGDLPAFKPAGRILIERAAFEAWFEASLITPRRAPSPTSTSTRERAPRATSPRRARAPRDGEHGTLARLRAIEREAR